MRILSIAPVILGSIGAIAPIFQCIKIIRPGKEGIKYRGNVVENKDGSTKIYKPGIHFKLPVVDNIKTMFVNDQTMVCKPQVVLLNDNTQFEVKASVRFASSMCEKQ